jgi:hypothetical protein
MASSPADPAAADSPRAFALQELVACWDQGYEALARGDLDQLTVLMDVAQEHLHAAGDGTTDSVAEVALRQEANAARGRLEHGMRSGLLGLQDEIAKSRVGQKALRGYARFSPAAGSLDRDA